MKKKSVAVLVLITSLALTGCGTQLTKLTDSERKQIIQYSAHVIGEFNKGQPEGYKAMNKKQLDEIRYPKEERVKEPETSTQATGTNGSNESGKQDARESESATLTQVVGTSGIEATYKGYKIQKDYVKDDVFAMNASDGNVYVVVNIELKNTTQSKVKCDILGMNNQIFLDMNNGEDSVKALTTLLPNDFSTFSEKIAGGAKKSTVLIFEVEKAKAESISNVSLRVEQGTSQKIILIN